MFHKIMLATDGSQFASRAADTVLELARRFENSHVTIMHVSQDAPSRSQLVQANMNIKSLLEADAHRAITETESKFHEANIAYRLEVALGDPADKIVSLAKQFEADLIVIGSRGLGTVSAMLLGSVSQRVTTHAQCPVMVVK